MKRINHLRPANFPKATLSLALLAGLALITVAPRDVSAQPQMGPPHRGERCVPAHVKALLPTFDVNKNGVLDPEEHHAMREAERKADLRTFDADGDGTLSKEEHAKLRQSKLVQHFEELDLDRNAEISLAEAESSCTPIAHHFARVDSDGSGSISWAEFEAGAPQGPPPGPPRHDEQR